jgi:transcriptional regulator with GAF, ATPase, and Fis domain
MPVIRLEAPDLPSRTVELTRPITTVGSSEDNDVRVPNAELEPTHLQFVRDGDRFFVVGMLRDMVVNGRREKRAQLNDGDEVRVGKLRVTFALAAPQTKEGSNARSADSAESNEAMQAYRRVYAFSKKLLDNAPTSQLVETILDSIIELTGADKGFLVLLEDGRPTVRAARNVDGDEVQLSLDQLSDTIMRRVIERKEPLVVEDALRDENWSASESVVNLRLSSVMCCPLLERDELRGLLYVGNHRVAHAFDPKALEVLSIFGAQASLLLSKARELEEVTTERTELANRLEETRFGRIVGACAAMQEVSKRVRKVATTDISVLITGETGTGKELIARQVHDQSRRSEGPFVVINCGAIPENLLESELFGHVRGAFTGAERTRQGRFQAADGGTLFLDEIGEMPLALQVKLLRALQEKVITKVGEIQPEPVDIRIVAATNRDLAKEVAAGRFREDLYYRLNVVNIVLPALRNRGDDLEVLAKFFLARATQNHARPIRGFTRSALTAMRKYAWPGNVRELENRIEKAVVLTEGAHLGPEDLDLLPEDLEEVLPLAEAKERFQHRYIQMVLNRNAGNRTQTAKELGVDPRTIFRHLERMQTSDLEEDPSSEGVGMAKGTRDLDPPES